ncbi:MAG: phosphatidylserine decarboxylase [Bdellovibrionia bacterium]
MVENRAPNQTGPNSISFWNRAKAQEEIEQVYGEDAVRLIYDTKIGQSLAEGVLSRTWFSKLYGTYQASSVSAHKVEPFVKKFNIPMADYEAGPFKSFNEFFIRKFRDGKRPFVSSPSEMGAFAEARYLAYEKILPEQKFPVKGKSLSAAALLGSKDKGKIFEGGPLLLARLCPTDYHRFHFPDAGRVIRSYTIHGKLHSVNPLALKYKDDIFITNERQVSILETQNFGRLAYIEVGALCVGRIIQSFNKGGNLEFKRGQEKGYFLFGGSTVIVLGEPGIWTPDSDLLEQTRQGRETLVCLGDRVGTRIKKI